MARSSCSRWMASGPSSSLIAESRISISGNRRRTSVSARLMMCGPSRNGIPTRSSPVIRVPAPASVASAERSSTRIRSACSTSARPAGVSTMWLPVRSMSAVPASASSADICWDTADRVYCRRRAAAAMDPSAMTASNMISFRTSSTETSHPLTLHVVDSNSRLLAWHQHGCCSDAMQVTLTEVQRYPTCGARAVEPVHVGGHELLAVPQLARDIPGGSPGMNGGDSDTDLLLLNRAGGRLEPWATLPAPGGEDAGFFTIGARAFLAVASIRTGAGPYQFAATSTIFEWRADGFACFQEVPTFAAKQWRHWQIGGRHFLGLAQGGILPPGHAGPDQGANRDSVVYEWDGAQFVEFQPIPSQWSYNWHAFTAGGEYFVAHAEHAGPSVLYRWDGTRLAPHQTLAAESGRAFATFDDGDKSYLVVACIAAPTRLLRRDGARFAQAQVLDGLGARELAVTRCGGRTLLIRINFILGTPANPRPALDSQIYEWDGNQLREVATFPTCGGTDVTVVGDGDGGGDAGAVELIVTNSLTPELRFAAATVCYQLSAGVR